MTATVTPATTLRRRGASPATRRLRAALAAIAGAWSAFVASGQLGPSSVVTLSRHTGARI